MDWLNSKARLSGTGKRMDFLIQAAFQGFQGHLHIIMGLKIEPELRFHTEESSQTKGSIGGYGPPPVYDFIDAPGGYTNIFGQPVLGHTHRFQKFRQQDLTGMDGGKITFCHLVTS
jgi:hypothetical protein